MDIRDDFTDLYIDVFELVEELSEATDKTKEQEFEQKVEALGTRILELTGKAENAKDLKTLKGLQAITDNLGEAISKYRELKGGRRRKTRKSRKTLKKRKTRKH